MKVSVTPTKMRQAEKPKVTPQATLVRQHQAFCGEVTPTRSLAGRLSRVGMAASLARQMWAGRLRRLPPHGSATPISSAASAMASFAALPGWAPSS